MVHICCSIGNHPEININSISYYMLLESDILTCYANFIVTVNKNIYSKIVIVKLIFITTYSKM